MKRVQLFIYRLLTQRLPKRSVRFPHYERSMRILLLFESDYTEANKRITQLSQQLRDDRHEVVTWGYADKKEVLSSILPQSRIFGQNDFNWLGIPTAATLHDIKAEHFDVLINLSATPCLATDYITAYAQADCKIAQYADGRCADIMIHTHSDDTEYLFEQILHYIQNIKSND